MSIIYVHIDTCCEILSFGSSVRALKCKTAPSLVISILFIAEIQIGINMSYKFINTYVYVYVHIEKIKGYMHIFIYMTI
jgi:hypothetical protein